MWDWSGLMDGVDTPQTVMTPRAPAVLKMDLFALSEKAGEANCQIFSVRKNTIF